MTDTRTRRLAKRQAAADALETHTGPVLGLLASVVHDLAEEVEGLRQFEQDAAYAAELSYRIDKAIDLGDPLLEALDSLVIFFVALGAIGIWRAAARADKLRGAKLDRLRDRLEGWGPMLAKAAKLRLARWIKRLEKRV